jgi:hypothetical protein
MDADSADFAAIYVRITALYIRRRHDRPMANSASSAKRYGPFRPVVVTWFED